MARIRHVLSISEDMPYMNKYIYILSFVRYSNIYLQEIIWG